MASTGFNTSGGAYYIVTANLDGPLVGDATVLYKLVSAGSNSGGAWVEPTLATVKAVEVAGGLYTQATAAALVDAGSLLKDMGKTVVSNGVMYRKFAAVGSSAASFGVVGSPATAPNAGYASFYLRVGREGSGAPAPIARYA